MPKKEDQLSEDTTPGNNKNQDKTDTADTKPVSNADHQPSAEIKNAHATGDGAMGRENDDE